MSGAVRIAETAWGDEMPDWVAALAAECEATSGNKVAVRLDRSAALVSQVLRNRYPGNLAAVEERVRGVLMAGTVECPALGALPLQDCQDWRRKARSFSNHNSLRVRMYRACSRCPINRRDKE